MIKEAQQILPWKPTFLCLILWFNVGTINQSKAQILTTGIPIQDRILGKWMSEEKNVVVQIYKNGNKYGAKIIWFDDADDKTKPMNTRVDYKNPDPALRTRKIIGMEVVDNLSYNPQNNSWDDGMIYDAVNGRTWSSTAHITNKGILKVTGYWHFKFLGKTMTFKRT